jgi:GDP-4-dehydro-6-deoxy-D-mannose reductase
MAGKRVLITGITGMVGSHLAEYLLEKTDWEIFGMCRWRSPLDNLANIAQRINANDRVSLVYGDLRDTLSIQAAVAKARPDYVFHLAAQSFPRTSFDSPLDTMDTNIQGTVRVLDALRQTSPKAIIHVCASSEVFGRVPKEKLPIDEECSFHPASTRMFTHTGPRRGDVFAESTFAKQIAMIEHKLIPPVVKVGNLQSLRTVADVRDAVRAYYMLVTVKPVSGAYYNIGGTHSCTIGDILNTLMSFSPSKSDIRIEVDPDRLRPIDADLQVPNTAKFEAHTGWKPEIGYEQTLRDLLDYWRDRIATEGNRFLTR